MKNFARIALLCLLIASLLLGVVACQRPEQLNEMERLYRLAVDGGFEGSYEEWLGALKAVPGEKGEVGDVGAKGEAGDTGAAGDDGLSAYELYCKYHPTYRGTEDEWVTALGDGSLAASYTTHYNIIFTLATIPPVLSSLDAIESGYVR